MRVELDSLLGDEEPHASFHDASLLAVRVDYVGAELVADLELCVGDPMAPNEPSRERRRTGTLTLRGLMHWSLEPFTDAAPRSGPLWLTSDGPLDDAPTAAGQAIAASLPADCFAWYLFFSDINAYGYCACRHAEFAWR